MQGAWPPHRVLVVDLVTRAVGGLEETALRRIESEAQRLDRDLELCATGRPYDRHVLVGAACHPGERDVCRSDAAARGHFAHAAGDLLVDLITVEVLVDVVS